MTPIRIQRKRTKGWKMPPNTIYVGRPTKWENPCIVGHLCEFGYVYDAVHATALFRSLIRDDHLCDAAGRIVAYIPELSGANLACWCPLDQPCHADVLLDIANS